MSRPWEGIVETTLKPLGLTSLAAVGPLDEAALEDEGALRVCDVGHIAIAWRDWDARLCPLCQRAGTVSAVLATEHAAIVEAVQKDADEKVTLTEESERKMTQAIIEAKAVLNGAV